MKVPIGDLEGGSSEFRRLLGGTHGHDAKGIQTAIAL
jgi:hypothetical protein